MAGDDFIEGDYDMFDPQVADYVEQKAQVVEATENDRVEAFIRRRKQAYMSVFADPNKAEDLEFVLLDLAQFCRAYAPTFDLNAKLQDLKEGRREVYMRIMDFTRLSHETLFVKYTDAQQKRG